MFKSPGRGLAFPFERIYYFFLPVKPEFLPVIEVEFSKYWEGVVLCQDWVPHYPHVRILKNKIYIGKLYVYYVTSQWRHSDVTVICMTSHIM